MCRCTAKIRVLFNQQRLGADVGRTDSGSHPSAPATDHDDVVAVRLLYQIELPPGVRKPLSIIPQYDSIAHAIRGIKKKDIDSIHRPMQPDPNR